MTLDLKAPTSWSELTQEQLDYLLRCIALINRTNTGRRFSSREDFSAQSAAQVAIRCLFHWNGIRVRCPYGSGWLIAHDGEEGVVSTADLAAATEPMAWISSIPEQPVRLDTIDGAHAVAADIDDGFSFDDYLSCEALWQVWQDSQQDQLLRDMAAILYRKEDIAPKEHELLSVFYWWASLKEVLSRRYPDFLKSMPVGSGASHVDEQSLRRSMDSQIRALTKGDITKEDVILALPAHRALTELDALAREYDELNRKYPQK